MNRGQVLLLKHRRQGAVAADMLQYTFLPADRRKHSMMYDGTFAPMLAS